MRFGLYDWPLEGEEASQLIETINFLDITPLDVEEFEKYRFQEPATAKPAKKTH